MQFVDEILGYRLHWFFPLCNSWKPHKWCKVLINFYFTFYEKTFNIKAKAEEQTKIDALFSLD